ncbi:MAG: crossover junction endodeoxyribonuclease RuvC [Deltaproteobacteria bacterium]|nr:MAG: crossover junction endodeoxyribonuclease RuvC [Deltaproteobacteria bacterium]
MRILGIDPGSRLTGYGLIEGRGQRLRHIDNGVIVTSSGAPLPRRLKCIHDGIAELITRHRPDVVAVENIFVAHNVQSALKLGHARASAMLAALNAGLDVHEYSALQVKSAVVGYGKADKHQVQQMVRTLLCLPEVAQEDAADALAVAICHLHSAPLTDRLTNAMRGGRR